MEHFVGLDVAVRETSICIVDGDGKTLRETRAATEPAAIEAALARFSPKRVGLEAGPLSQWLYAELAAAGVPVVCVETRHMKAALSAQLNKNDRNDARGIARMMRVGLDKPVHVKRHRRVGRHEVARRRGAGADACPLDRYAAARAPATSAQASKARARAAR